jgi:hypothetical protein
VAGLFTLDNDDLGRLDANALGGFGTGFIVGATTSAGSATGVQGFTGSASGSTTSSGTAQGTRLATGQVSGATTSTGITSGVINATGTLAGSTHSQGALVGSPGLFGSITSGAATSGSATGSPDLAGNAGGSSASTGSAVGQPDAPPTPPPPPAPVVESGGGPRYFREPIRQQPRPQPVPVMLHASGRVRGGTTSTGRAAGRCGFVGVVRNVQMNAGTCTGTRWPTDEIVNRWARQAREDELLTIGLL